jgi:hypothetical protein
MNYNKSIFDNYNYKNKDQLINILKELNDISLEDTILDINILNKYNYIITSIMGYTDMLEFMETLINKRDEYILKAKDNNTLSNDTTKHYEDILTDIANSETFFGSVLSDTKLNDYTKSIKELINEDTDFIIRLTTSSFYYYKSNNAFVGLREDITELSESNVDILSYIEQYKDDSIKENKLVVSKPKYFDYQKTKFYLIVNDSKYSILDRKHVINLTDISSLLNGYNIAEINKFDPKLRLQKTEKVSVIDYILSSSIFDSSFRKLVNEAVDINNRNVDSSLKSQMLSKAIYIFLMKLIYFENKLDVALVEKLSNINLFNSVENFRNDFIIMVETIITFFAFHKEKLYVKQANENIYKLLISLLEMYDSPQISTREFTENLLVFK